MSELQIGLLIIGVVTIAAVIAYNKIQDLKYRRLAERNFSSNHDDALLEPAEKSEQQESAGRASGESGSIESDISEPPRIEPTLTADLKSPVDDSANTNAALPPRTGDESDSIYCTVMLSSDGPMNAARLAASFDAISEAFSKPTRLLVWNQKAQDWTEADAATSDAVTASQFSAGIQLVDRQGPIGAEELAGFLASVADCADEFELAITPADSTEAQGRARKIDEFCCDVDIQIVLHLVSRDQPFAGTKIRAIAEADGFQADADGLFKRLDDEGRCLYSAADGEGGLFRIDAMKETASSSISLQFDLPRAPGGIATFDQFCAAASRFATALGAQMVDDNRVEISAGALKSIREQVGQVQARMNAAGFPPGSPVALRLFS